MIKFFTIFILSLLVIKETYALEKIHPSYKMAKECFPVLANSELEKKFNLDHLKDSINHNFVTLRSRRLYRKVKFKDDEGKIKILSLVSKPKNKYQFDEVLSIEVIDDKNNHSNFTLPKNHQVNPSKAIVNSYLAVASIIEDEESIEDYKAQNTKMLTTSKNSQLIELLFDDVKSNKKLSCDMRSNLVFCICK